MIERDYMIDCIAFLFVILISIISLLAYVFQKGIRSIFPGPYRSLCENHYEYEDGLISCLVDEEQKTIILKGYREGIWAVFRHMNEAFSDSGFKYHHHFEGDSITDAKYDFLVFKEDSIPVTGSIADHSTEISDELVKVYNNQEHGVFILSAKENLKEFTSVMSQYLSNKDITNEVIVNKTPIGGKLWLTNDSWEFKIKIEKYEN